MATMGNAPSSPANPPANEDEPAIDLFKLPPPPPPTLSTLPPDALRLVATQLMLPSLSSLACTCSEIAQSVAQFDDLFGVLLEQHVALIGDRMNRVPDPEDDELLSLISSLASPTAGDCRLGCSLLRAQMCVLCGARAPSGLYFSLTRLGICAPCVTFRPGHAERWRRAQFKREARAQQRADDATRRALSVLADALPPMVRGSSLGKQDGADAEASCTDATDAPTPGSSPQLRPAPLPRLHSCNVGPRMRLIFDSSRHGGSCSALLRAAEGATSSILLAHANGGGRFGAFIDEPWDQRSVASFFGGRGCFLFRLGRATGGGDQPAADSAGTGGEMAIYRSTGLDGHYVHASSAHAIGFGGLVGSFGLSFETDLTRGQCRPSMTYGSGASGLSAEADFLCDTVQLWSVESSATSERVRRSKLNPWQVDADDEEPSALEPGENKLLLEFIGIDKEVAMMRRFQ